MYVPKSIFINVVNEFSQRFDANAAEAIRDSYWNYIGNRLIDKIGFSLRALRFTRIFSGGGGGFGWGRGVFHTNALAAVYIAATSEVRKIRVRRRTSRPGWTQEKNQRE